jgi:signal transduction histidine kinase
VAKALPRLERALNRAVALASHVLDYGKSQEHPPEPVAVHLLAAVDAAGEDAGLAQDGAVRLQVLVDPAITALADPEQLHRVLVNLLRNAREAIQSAPGPRPPGLIQVASDRKQDKLLLRVSDNGPGLPVKATERLFQPFSGSARPGGTGLGLAISRELIKANGGELTLLANGSDGAVFELSLPEAPLSS